MGILHGKERKNMKKIRKITAVLLAALMVMTVQTISAGAISVVRDGKEYTLGSHTPTTGDVNVLMVRLGFADYSVDDAEYPAVSEQTLLSYFDGTEGSVNAFYETSSYGKLRLHCDKVYTYNAQLDRGEYDSDNDGAASSPEGLIEETLTALKDQIDFDMYDSNSDGILDVVCFDFAGPLGKWSSTWWPHVMDANINIGGKTVITYTFLQESANIMTHEFGHIFGASDYYSYNANHDPAIATFDMMCGNEGDHNGFTKWTYGWFSNDDIAFVSKASGDTAVSLAPLETPLGDGKKIAVVAPAIDEQTPFLGEYFLVEYDSGTANNKEPFDNYNLHPGFRIFHVNANSSYNDEELTVGFDQSNYNVRANLIHNAKNELEDPLSWATQEMFFRDGDSLTPEDYPNTGLTFDTVYNGAFTGISFTDFVTGDNPSFQVSFSEEQIKQPDPKITLTFDSLSADIQMTLTSDKPLNQKKMFEEDYEAPYLIDSQGIKLTLEVQAESNSNYRFTLRYSNTAPPVASETKYTLVIPEGYFRTGYMQSVP